MAVNASYGALLKRYTPEKLIMNEFAERSYIWKNIEKDESWKGGVYEIPVQRNGFNSVQMGTLPAANDIAEGQFSMGTLTTHKELVLSAIINEGDLARHGDMEASYLKILPDMVNDLADKGVGLINAGVLRGGGVISFATGNGALAGTIAVANPEYFEPAMKVEVIDNDTAAATGYVTQVDIATGTLTIQTLRSGGVNVDLSAFTTAQSARVRLVGAGTESFIDMRAALLPNSLGGSDTLYGLTKLTHMPLQAYRKDGSGFTAATILRDILGAYFECRRLGRGKQSEIWVDYGMFARIVSQLDVAGARQYSVTDKSAGYGFNSITFVGAEGQIKLVALREMPVGSAYLVDWSGLKFAGLPLKRNLYGEAGQEYFTVRNTTGVQFISDMILRGEFVYQPAKLGIIHSIPASISQL